MTTLDIGSRTYQVSTMTEYNGQPVWELRGKRGAHYFTMRNVHDPLVMFVCDARGFGPVKSLDHVWLTDRSGSLEVL